LQKKKYSNGYCKAKKQSIFEKVTLNLAKLLFSSRAPDILRLDNFKAVIPSAAVLGDAIGYLCGIYGVNDGVFTAYYVARLFDSKK